MDVDHLSALQDEAVRLVDAVSRVDLDARVPGLEWNARTVAIHTGAVHRWAADIVCRRLPRNETGGSRTFWPTGLADADLPEWIGDGLLALVDELSRAPADLSCFVFVPGASPRTFWRRRQAHETAIHRVDIESCGAAVAPFDAEFAQDGLAEVVGQFAVERRFATPSAGTLLLQASDGPSWRVVFGGDRNVVTSGRAGDLGRADATVSASSSALYRWAWNRPVTDEAISVSGDQAVLDLWRAVRVS